MPLNQRQQQEIIAAGDAFGAAFANHVAEQQPAAAAASTATGSTSSRGTDIRSDAAGDVAFANTDFNGNINASSSYNFCNVKINLHLLIYALSFMAKYAGGGGIENNYLIHSQ